jgi:hypothetical protein
VKIFEIRPFLYIKCPRRLAKDDFENKNKNDLLRAGKRFYMF